MSGRRSIPESFNVISNEADPLPRAVARKGMFKKELISTNNSSYNILSGNPKPFNDAPPVGNAQRKSTSFTHKGGDYNIVSNLPVEPVVRPASLNLPVDMPAGRVEDKGVETNVLTHEPTPDPRTNQPVPVGVHGQRTAGTLHREFRAQGANVHPLLPHLDSPNQERPPNKSAFGVLRKEFEKNNDTDVLHHVPRPRVPPSTSSELKPKVDIANLNGGTVKAGQKKAYNILTNVDHS